MILAAIRELGLTQNEVAQAVHKCKSYVSMILREQITSDPIMTDIKSFLAIKILNQRKNFRQPKFSAPTGD